MIDITVTTTPSMSRINESGEEILVVMEEEMQFEEGIEGGSNLHQGDTL